MTRWNFVVRPPHCVCLALLWAAPLAASPLDDYLFASDAQFAPGAAAPVVLPPSSPWIDDTELRLSPEVDAANVQTETYGLRFRPVGRKERRTVRELYDIEQALANAKWRKSLSAALASRYHRVIDLAEHEVRVALHGRQLALDRSVLAAEQTLAASERFDAARLQAAALRVELAEHDADQARRRAAALRQATVADYLRVAEQGLPSVSSRVATPMAVATALDAVAASLAATAFDAQLATLEQRQAEHEVMLDAQRSGLGLNFMEVGYENKVVTRYNLKFGVRLPFGRRTQNSQRRVRDAIAAERRADLTDMLVRGAVQNAIREIRWQIDAYAASDAGLARLAGRLQASSADVSTQTVLRRHQLELLAARTSAHIGVLHDFVELLDFTGQLQQQPARNWLEGRAP